jgi:hypothetical protein
MKNIFLLLITLSLIGCYPLQFQSTERRIKTYVQEVELNGIDCQLIEDTLLYFWPINFNDEFTGKNIKYRLSLGVKWRGLRYKVISNGRYRVYVKTHYDKHTKQVYLYTFHWSLSLKKVKYIHIEKEVMPEVKPENRGEAWINI